MPTRLEQTIEDETFDRIWNEVKDFTMTSRIRGYALYLAVRYLVENTIHGAFVECGVWRGGSVMLMLRTLIALGTGGRDIFLFDTFSGMSEPKEMDVDLHGRKAADLLEQERDDPNSLIVARASLEEVRKNIARCGYPENRIHFIRGDVRETLPLIQTGPIALLRLDTDFYDSTKAELEELYPRVNRGGVLIIDDYGHWRGARRAVDEYFSPETCQVRGIEAPLLLPVDYTGRFGTRPDTPTRILIRPYDYRSPGLDAPDLLPLFPSLQPVLPDENIWDYLRYKAPHIWRVDKRHDPNSRIGVLSVDEATLLYALARQFRGRRSIEIGCHFGWSTAHLVAAGLSLDVVDPALGNPKQMAAVESSLSRVASKIPGTGRWRLWPGYSPGIIPAIARAAGGRKWAFAFIDGNHDGDAPANDAKGILPYMAEDAMVVFHDLMSPHVYAGLEVFREAGWNTRLYNTMQIMGIAWRGQVKPVEHVPDPNLPYPVTSHLRGANVPYSPLYDHERDFRHRHYPENMSPIVSP